MPPDQTLITETYTALGRQFGPVLQEAAQTAKLPQNWGQLWIFLEYEPDPVTVDRLLMTNPYTSPNIHVARLDEYVEAGLMTRSESDEYRLTDDSRAKVKGVIQALTNFLATYEPIPAADLKQIVDLLQRVIERAVSSPEPSLKAGLLRNRKSDPGQNGSLMFRVMQYFSDFGPYRDDCHLASWAQHGISGQAWEAFTYLWSGEATSAKTLADKLENRGYSLEDYAVALDQLAERGWVESADTAGNYRLTPLGQELRQASEDLTDQYYFSIWDVLSESEQQTTIQLLKGLQDALTIPEAPTI